MSETANRILELCCHPAVGYELRYNMTTPFNRAGWRYATDSRIAARVKTTEPDTEGQFPPVEDVYVGWAWRDSVPFVDPGPLPEPGDPCRACKGTGRVATCPRCGGDGFYNVGNCRMCLGDGVVAGDEFDCSECVAGKAEPEVESVAFGDKSIGGDYARLLWAFGVRELIVPTKGISPFLWRVGEVDGLLMPVTFGTSSMNQAVRARLRRFAR